MKHTLGSKSLTIQGKGAEVKEYSDKLDICKSAGPREIHPGVLQVLAEVISELLAIISESSWRMSEVPADGRKANTEPVFEKGKWEDLGNHRPVSLALILRKMQEQIIEQSICKHLEENKVIRNSLLGFVKNKSHQSNLISFFDSVTGPVDKEEEADVIDLDFSEAFDTHPHDIFISKQKKYGLDEVIM